MLLKKWTFPSLLKSIHWHVVIGEKKKSPLSSPPQGTLPVPHDARLIILKEKD